MSVRDHTSRTKGTKFQYFQGNQALYFFDYVLTPPRTDIISGLKSQVFKPPFLAKKKDQIYNREWF